MNTKKRGRIYNHQLLSWHPGVFISVLLYIKFLSTLGHVTTGICCSCELQHCELYYKCQIGSIFNRYCKLPSRPGLLLWGLEGCYGLRLPELITDEPEEPIKPESNQCNMSNPECTPHRQRKGFSSTPLRRKPLQMPASTWSTAWTRPGQLWSRFDPLRLYPNWRSRCTRRARRAVIIKAAVSRQHCRHTPVSPTVPANRAHPYDTHRERPFCCSHIPPLALFVCCFHGNLPTQSAAYW